MYHHKDINSKLRIFLVLILLIASFDSCKKSELDVIPNVYVEFYIDLSDPEFLSLNAITNYVLIDEFTNNFGYRSAGYDNNGIILYRAGLDEFFAFDRTCPHDYANNGTSVAVDTVANEIYVICPECNSKYVLPSFGSPTEGPSRYPLKIYKTSFDGSGVRVYN